MVCPECNAKTLMPLDVRKDAWNHYLFKLRCPACGKEFKSGMSVTTAWPVSLDAVTALVNADSQKIVDHIKTKE